VLVAAAAANTAAAALQPTAAAAAGLEGSDTAAKPPGDVEVVQVQGWLRRLALVLGPLRGSGDEPASVPLKLLEHSLPLPSAVLQWYGSLQRFVARRPELLETTANYCAALYLVRSCHRQLLEEADRAGMTAGELLQCPHSECGIHEALGGLIPYTAFTRP
jgi:hypothetical protein